MLVTCWEGLGYRLHFGSSWLAMLVTCWEGLAATDCILAASSWLATCWETLTAIDYTLLQHEWTTVYDLCKTIIPGNTHHNILFGIQLGCETSINYYLQHSYAIRDLTLHRCQHKESLWGTTQEFTHTPTDCCYFISYNLISDLSTCEEQQLIWNNMWVDLRKGPTSRRGRFFVFNRA